MTKEKAELDTAIQTAARHAQFVIPSGAGGEETRLGAAEFSEQVARFKAGGLDVRRHFARAKVEVSNEGEPIATLLRNSSTLRRFMDEKRELIYIIGNVGPSITRAMRIEEACAKIIKSVAFHPLGQVVDTLATFLRTGTFPMRILHLLKGTKVPEAIQLDSSAQLVPYATALNQVTLLDNSLLADTKIPTDPNLDACGLLLDAAVRPGAPVHHTDDTSLGVQEEEYPRLLYSGVAEFGHDFICVMLGLISGKLFLPFSHYEIIPEVYSDSLPMFASTGSTSVTNVEFPIFHSRNELTFVDCTELIRLVTAYSQAPEHVRRHLHIPLARLRHAKEKAGDADRAIDLHIAFEALLGRPTSRERQRRAAWLYAETPDEVKFVKGTIQKFSAHRNRIVHGKSFSENPQLVSQAESILIVCIKWIIRNQRIPCWTKEITSPMGNPQIKNPGLIRSHKHDTTSWTVTEAHVIDKALSKYWQAKLVAGSLFEAPADKGSENALHAITHSGIAEPNRSDLMAVHPYWRTAVETNDKAKLFHCETDVEKHLSLWKQALAELS